MYEFLMGLLQILVGTILMTIVLSAVDWLMFNYVDLKNNLKACFIVAVIAKLAFLLTDLILNFVK